METIPSIDIMSHIGLGFPIHEEIERHRGTPIMMDNRSDIDFHNIGMPPNNILEFYTLRHAFPQVQQKLFPNERPNAVPGHHIPFTQIPSQKKVNAETYSLEASTSPYDLIPTLEKYIDEKHEELV